MNIFKRIYSHVRLEYAINKADEAHFLTQGDCFYVMPSGASGKLVIVNRAAMRLYKRQGIVDRTITMADLERDCFYRTPKRLSPLPAEVLRYKRERYFEWVELLARNKRR